MKRPINLLIGFAALLAVLNLSGCALMHDDDNYRYEHGDRISGDGTIRYVGWCYSHPHNSHCANQSSGDESSGEG